MVEIVITFADGYQCRCEMVSWSVLVIERSIAQPMSKRVDTERRLHIYMYWLVEVPIHKRTTDVMNETQPENACINIATQGIVPEQPGDDSWNSEGNNKDHGKIIFMLPFDNRVLAQITDVRNAWLTTRFEQHPANVGVEKAFVSIIRIEVGVGVSMVCSVAS